MTLVVRWRRVARYLNAWLAAALIASSSCASKLPALTVQAGRAEVELLSGVWDGRYWGGRDHSGRITFDLKATDGEAHGQVLMVPAGSALPYARSPRIEVPADASDATGHTTPLAIRMVQAAGETITGVLSPYWDPERRCDARATFRGRVTGRTIDGTFVSTCASGGPTISGRWSVHRIADAAPSAASHRRTGRISARRRTQVTHDGGRILVT